MTLGEKIREARKQAGLTQGQLAEKISVSRPAVAKWETDKGLPDIENLRALAKLLNVSVDYLLDDQEEKSLSEIREPICLDDYSGAGYHGREDAAVAARFSGADTIRPLIRKRKLSRAEWILDLVASPGVFSVADKVRDSSAYYLVEQGDAQYLVNVTKEFITATRLARRITERKFTVGDNVFTAASYTVRKKG